ncbi:MAG: hypothetical protein WD042_11390 [Phycisphaeraceae bacterium]
MTGPDYILDISGLSQPAGAEEVQSDAAGRPWIAIHWRCCGVYSRVYRHRDATCYKGRCPKCRREVRLKVGPGGTNSRFFEAE